MSVNTTIDNSCPRCKANQPMHIKVGEKHFIKCLNCGYAFHLIGTEETTT